jgi:hypothetical protein
VILMSSIPTLSSNLRASINGNLNEIVELHENILGDLHRVVPHSEYTQANSYAEARLSTPASGHNRWRSLDAVPEHAGGSTWLQKIPGMTAEPKIAAAVARIFGNKACFPPLSLNFSLLIEFQDEAFFYLRGVRCKIRDHDERRLNRV